MYYLPYSLNKVDELLKIVFDNYLSLVGVSAERKLTDDCTIRICTMRYGTNNISDDSTDLFFETKHEGENSTSTSLRVYVQFYRRHKLPFVRFRPDGCAYFIEINKGTPEESNIERDYEDHFIRTLYEPVFDATNLTEEKYFQLSTIQEMGLSLEELRYIIQDNSAPDEFSAIVRVPSSTDLCMFDNYDEVLDGMIVLVKSLLPDEIKTT